MNQRICHAWLASPPMAQPPDSLIVNSKFSFLTEDTKNSKYIYFEINNDIFEILVKNTCKSIPRKSRLLISCIEKSK